MGAGRGSRILDISGSCSSHFLLSALAEFAASVWWPRRGGQGSSLIQRSGPSVVCAQVFEVSLLGNCLSPRTFLRVLDRNESLRPRQVLRVSPSFSLESRCMKTRAETNTTKLTIYSSCCTMPRPVSRAKTSPPPVSSKWSNLNSRSLLRS